MSSMEFTMSIQLAILPAAKSLSTSVNFAYESTAMMKTQKDKEDKEENGGWMQPKDNNLSTSEEKQLGHIYHNADLFPTLPNAAYGTVGKTILLAHTLHLLFLHQNYCSRRLS